MLYELKTWANALILFVLISSNTAFAQEMLRVQVAKSKNSIQLRGSDLRIGDDNLSDVQSVFSKNSGIQDFSVTRENSIWVISSSGGGSVSHSGQQLKIGGKHLKIENKNMDSDLYFVADHQNLIHVIAHISIEDYLKGVLPSEMPAQWPLESFKAQAVAARTYALNAKAENEKELFDLDDSVQSQVYHLDNYSKANIVVRQKIDRAIEDTRGLFLADARGRPGRIYFHSDCGGITENSKFVWGNASSHSEKVIHDERCRLNPLSEWNEFIERRKIEAALNPFFRKHKSASIKNIFVESFSESGRNYEIVIQYLDGFKGLLTGQQFRKLLGFSRVKSTLFSHTWTAQGLELKGRGHGHGVGLCQKGARFMALAGASFQRIVSRYYPNLKLKTKSNSLKSEFLVGKVSQNKTL